MGEKISWIESTSGSIQLRSERKTFLQQAGHGFRVPIAPTIVHTLSAKQGHTLFSNARER